MIPDPRTRQFPLTFNERTGMILNPNANVLQFELNRFQQETQQQKLVAIRQKTFIMMFDPSKKYSFPPEFYMGQTSDQHLAVKDVHKILGVHVQNDPRWNTQDEQMVKKGSKKIWLLRRMRQMGVDQKTIATYWK